MRKYLSLIIATIVITFSMGIPSYAATPNDQGIISEPQIVHSYKKTVVKEYPKSIYPDLGNIPQSIQYDEYSNNSWFHGTLTVRSVVSGNNSWIVTYSGTLVGII